MKKIFALLSIVCIVFASCSDEDTLGGNKYKPAQSGEEIVFGSRMTFENSDKQKSKQTRTVYGDKKPGTNGFTEIKWLQGDQVRIYCEQTEDATVGIGGVAGAEKRKYCDYTVAGDYIRENKTPMDGEYEDYHSVGLVPVGENNKGLTWGTGTHQFYGVYPTPGMLDKASDVDAVAALSITSTGVTAHLPNTQRPRQFVAPATETITVNNGESKEINHYTMHPSMRYAYMLAKASASPADGGVDLVFNPIVTAVEITLQNTGNSAINGISLVSLSAKDEVICGSFTCSFNYDIKTTSTDGAYRTVSVPVEDPATGKGVTLNKYDKMTVNAFMILPEGADLSEINVTLVYNDGAGRKTATVSGSNSLKVIQAKRRNFISTVEVNFGQAAVTAGLESWFSNVAQTEGANDTNVTMRRLSIPVAGGAASGYADLWNSDKVQAEVTFEQNLKIEDLWKQGVRGFEFTVDISGTGNLGNSTVYCNGKSCNVTLSYAVSEVKKMLLKYPTEFAMVIVTYQDNDGWATRNDNGGIDNYTRKPNTFLSELNEFWKTVTTGIWSTDYDSYRLADGTVLTIGKDIIPGTALYSSTTTVGNARGKMFCIARPTSNEEDNYTTFSRSTFSFSVSERTPEAVNKSNVHDNVLVIEGWGALKDKWEARGYTTCPFHRGNGDGSDLNDMSSTQKNKLGYNSGYIGRPFDVASTFNSNNGFSTLRSAKGTADEDGYVDRKRSSLNTNFNYSWTASNGSTGTAYVQEWARVSNTTGIITGSDGKYYWWPNSTNEKIDNVVECLNAAVADTGNKIYINSLCGYFIDKNILDSYLPNGVTDMNVKYEALSVFYSKLTGNSATGGMSGNIGSYTQWMNNWFYNYILTNASAYSGKAVGMIMMDRVSNDPNNTANYYIPRIIVSNNPFIEAEEATVSLNITDETLDVDNGDVPAAPAKR